MTSRFLFAVLISGLLLSSPAALGDQGKGRGRGGPVAIGAFDVQSASHEATGDHLSFSYTDAGIDGFRAANRTLFDIRVTGATAGGDDREDGDDDPPVMGARAKGAQLRVGMPNYTFVAHDSPTAASKLETDGTIQVIFREGVVAARQGPDGVRFSFGDVSGILRGENASLNGRTVTARQEVVILLDAARGSFDQHHRDLGRAIASGHIGAETTINLGDDARTSEDAVSYGNVTMTTLKAERGNITLLIDGHGFDGRVVVLNVDGRVLGAERADKLNIQLDNESISPASNLTDILDPDDDGYAPEYYVVFDPQEQAFQLIVTLPHYSMHTLSVTTALELVKPSVVIGVLAGVALLVPTALVLFRRK